jgi:rhodanese-related sulfurtransferase
MNIATILPTMLLQRHREPGECELIDVRMPAEFRALHVEFARNIPLEQLDPKELMRLHRGSTDGPLYLICQAGKRSHTACEKFLQAGFTNVVSVEGGTQACEQAGLPMVRGKRTIGLERQVRIAAGSLVLIGILLGWLVHPMFFGLVVFVGAGLVFAGITDTCGMGILLARMPWNRYDTKVTRSCGT